MHSLLVGKSIWPMHRRPRQPHIYDSYSWDGSTYLTVEWHGDWLIVCKWSYLQNHRLQFHLYHNKNQTEAPWNNACLQDCWCIGASEYVLDQSFDPLAPMIVLFFLELYICSPTCLMLGAIVSVYHIAMPCDTIQPGSWLYDWTTGAHEEMCTNTVLDARKCGWPVLTEAWSSNKHPKCTKFLMVF